MLQRLVSRTYKNLRYAAQYRVLNELVAVDATADRGGYQCQKLCRLLQAAYDTVPYYHDLMGRTSLVAEDVVNLETLASLRELPFLTKAIIRSHPQALRARDADARKTYANTSGGSTGQPVSFLQDARFAAHTEGNLLLSYYWNGVSAYDRQVILWGAERDTYRGRKGLAGQIRDYVNNITLLNTFTLSDRDIETYIDIINKTQPKVIKGYAQSLYEIAEYALGNGIAICTEDCVVHSAASTLYDHMRESISRAFGAKVYNYYGSREVGGIASEVCGQGDRCLQVLFDNCFVEVVNDKGEPCEAGESGQIVVTTLNNLVMPLIRYRIGDVGVVGDDGGQCLRLEQVTGRTTDVFRTKRGTRVDGEYFTHLFYHVNEIERFQVVQHSLDRVLVRLVVTQSPGEAFYNHMKARICHVMGGDTDVVFEVVDEIPKTETGKFLYTISEV